MRRVEYFDPPGCNEKVVRDKEKHNMRKCHNEQEMEWREFKVPNTQNDNGVTRKRAWCSAHVTMVTASAVRSRERLAHVWALALVTALAVSVVWALTLALAKEPAMGKTWPPRLTRQRPMTWKGDGGYRLPLRRVDAGQTGWRKPRSSH